MYLFIPFFSFVGTKVQFFVKNDVLIVKKILFKEFFCKQQVGSREKLEKVREKYLKCLLKGTRGRSEVKTASMSVKTKTMFNKTVTLTDKTVALLWLFLFNYPRLPWRHQQQTHKYHRRGMRNAIIGRLPGCGNSRTFAP